MAADKSADRGLIRGLLLGLLAVGAGLFGYGIAVRPQNLYLIVGAALGLVVIAITFIEPVSGLYLFVGAMFTEALLMFGSVSAARLLGILVLGAWTARSLASGRFEIIMPTQAWLAVMFVLWGFLSAMWAMDLERLVTALLLLVQLVALYILVINLVSCVKTVQIILAIVTSVSLALALLTIARALSGDTIAGRVDLGRISMGNINAQAAYLVPSATLLMVLFSHQTRSVRRWLLLLGLSVIALAILATSSRGAIIAVSVVLVLGIIIDRRLLQVTLPALLVAAAALLVLPHTLVERLEAMVTLSDRAAGRVDIWLVALRIIRSHPALGVGLDGFAAAFNSYLPETPGIISDIGTGRASHNIFLNVQSELGVIGTALFLVLIGTTLRSGLLAVVNCRRAGLLHLEGLALTAWLSLVAMLLMGLFLDLQYWKLFWMLLALPEVMRRLSVEALLETPA
ncbi:MAG: hypothetical protein AMJ93_10110 [Anaerolineae bacterium SM23_84]|nr:MAG: hypothetical protein AMJ93_10110 [Anaerolineae bacterium SM23_84]